MSRTGQYGVPDDYVAMAEHICPVCGVKHTYNTEILINKYLRSIPKDKRITGYGMCEEHQKLFDEGFVAMVEVSNGEDGDALSQENAIRTGNLCHLRRTVFNEVFNTQIPDDLPMVFIGIGVIEQLQAMEAKEETKH